ncbi:hypothetical protein PR202_ga29860 [Eleusine coracana subsp. coracana]|uniref:Uncharacterized protein n=1 Tax=Eleusine coracana subsp. coracana TaxID=191504 RepID=A0AAV5DMH6_ELECO|nr:hypothetical protein PR202_ga29860 [Eleusine coracana subsp. coracana]
MLNRDATRRLLNYDGRTWHVSVFKPDLSYPNGMVLILSSFHHSNFKLKFGYGANGIAGMADHQDPVTQLDLLILGLEPKQT